jgi:opacity protein-like surface antigen
MSQVAVGQGIMKIIAAALAVVTMLGSPALAQMRSREASPGRFYLYGEYNYYTDSSDLRGGGGGLGWNFNRYLGLQGGAQFLTSSQSAGGALPSIASNAVNLDATILYGEAKLSWPLTESLSVYASAGAAYIDGSASVTLLTSPPATVSVSRSATGYRIGLGTEYWFSRHWGLRAGWHRQNAGGVADDIGAGIAFRF